MSGSLFSLEGKTALITGSAQGLGFTIAKGLGEAGARLILNGRNQERLDKAVAELAAQGLTVYSSKFDVTKKKEIEEAVRKINETIGEIDILVNNAGVQHRAPLEEFSETDWQRIMDVNLTGVFLVSQQVVKGMIRRKAGKIINICSMQSEVGRKTIAPYAASKGGVKMLTKAMATEWAAYNIQVNGIGPGYFITDMTKPLAEDPEFNRWLCNRTPANRWGDPKELIGTAVYLASEASDYVNGQIIYVDGGLLAAI